MVEIQTGVLREIIKDQASLGRHLIEVPILLRRLGLYEPLEDARAHLLAVLEQIDSDPLWKMLTEATKGRQLRRLVGGVALAEMVLSSLIDEDS